MCLVKCWMCHMGELRMMKYLLKLLPSAALKSEPLKALQRL